VAVSSVRPEADDPALVTTDSRLVANVRRIAVLRANALGDFIFSLPALDALRAAYPAAEIVLLARPWHRELLSSRPGPVDRVIVLPEGIPPDGAPALPPHEHDAVLGAIADEGCDIALQMHGGGRHSNPVVRSLGARVTAGCRTPDAPELDRWIRYVYYQSELARLMEVASLVGARPVRQEPRLEATDDDRAAASAALPELAADPWAVIHPGATDRRRRWPVERFAMVGDALAQRGLQVVVTGTPGETDLVQAVRDAMSAPVVDSVGRLGLSGLVGVLSGAAVVVSNDTGPLHLAAAVGTATVGIYWCGNALNGGTPLRARNRVAISWRNACPVCGVDCIRASCPHDASFVTDVRLDEVLDAALDVVTLPAPSSAPPAVLDAAGVS